MPKLKAIKLSRCGLLDDALMPLLNVIKDSCIERLDLSENWLTDASLTAISDLLRDPKCPLKFLRYFSLSSSSSRLQDLNVVAVSYFWFH